MPSERPHTGTLQYQQEWSPSTVALHGVCMAFMRMIIFAMALASGSAFVPSPKARLAATPTTAARAVVISQMPMPSTLQRKFILFDLDGSHHKEQMRLKVCPRPCAPLT